MDEILRAAAVMIFGGLAVIIFAILIRVVRSGPSAIRHLRRYGYGWQALRRGELPSSRAGSTIDLIEGLEFIGDSGRVSGVRQKRSISGEIA